MTLPKPYYSHGGIDIYHGDCREILPLLGRFDLLLTDPPWGRNLDTRYSTRQTPGSARRAAARGIGGGGFTRNHDHPPVAGDGEPFDPALALASASQAVLWGANNFSSRLPDSPCWLVWDRKCGKASESDITDCELAAVIGHRFKTVRLFRHMWAGFQRDSEPAQLHGHVHPTQKPVALMSWCLGFFPEAKTVVDPYMGSGPVAKACKDRGLRYVGIELVEKYCEIAAKRLAQEVLFQG